MMKPLVCFGFSYLFYSIVLVLSTYWFSKAKYARHIRSNISSIGNLSSSLLLTPYKSKISKDSDYIHHDLKEAGKQLSLLSFLKFFLQELEKFILINIGGDVMSCIVFEVLA